MGRRPAYDLGEAEQSLLSQTVYSQALGANLPLSQLAERTDEVPLDQDVYVICRSGGRSLRATAYLAQYGYDPVNVVGGMGAWADAEKPIVSETGETARVL